jgi:transposase
MICGVDISGEALDAFCLATGEARRFSNDAAGVAELAAWCEGSGMALTVMEATGSHSELVFLTLGERGLGVALVNPKLVRRFAESMGVLEKADRIDARIIARYARAKEVRPMGPPSPAQRELTSLSRHLSRLVVKLGTAKQQIASCRDEASRESLAREIGFLKSEIVAFETSIAAMIRQDRLWSRLDAALREVKGVANRTVARLLADLPEIGLISNKAAAKIAGLAPLVDESGKRKGKSRIGGGRASVRSILYLVADVARRFDVTLNDFAQRLRAAGKPKMVIRIALAHKLLVRLNAKARDARAQLALAA